MHEKASRKQLKTHEKACSNRLKTHEKAGKRQKFYFKSLPVKV